MAVRRDLGIYTQCAARHAMPLSATFCRLSATPAGLTIFFETYGAILSEKRIPHCTLAGACFDFLS